MVSRSRGATVLRSITYHVHPFLRHPVRGRKGQGDHGPQRDQRQIASPPPDLRLSQWDRAIPLRNVALDRIEPLVFQEKDQIVFPNGRLEEPFGVGGIRGHDDPDAGDVQEPGFEALDVRRAVGELAP